MQTEAKPKTAPLKSPWAQIVKAEPKQKDGIVGSAAESSQPTKSSSGAAVNNKHTLPSYAQAGLTQRKSAPLTDEKETASAKSADPVVSESQPADSEKHAPATPAPSTSPHPQTLSESSSGTAEKMPELANGGEASSSRILEQEVRLAEGPKSLSIQLFNLNLLCNRACQSCICCDHAGRVPKASQDGVENSKGFCTVQCTFTILHMLHIYSPHACQLLQHSQAGGPATAALGSTGAAWPSLRDAKEQKVAKKTSPASIGDKQVQLLLLNQPSQATKHVWLADPDISPAICSNKLLKQIVHCHCTYLFIMHIFLLTGLHSF